MTFFRSRRRRRLKAQTPPAEWRTLLLEQSALYKTLPQLQQEALLSEMQVFLHEKHFEGCGGLRMNDEIAVVIAAHACILLLGRQHNYYPGLRSILVYPHAFISPLEVPDGSGLVEEYDDVREGESWELGALVLSWEDVQRDVGALDGHDVVLHEFAHQIFENHDFHFDRRDELKSWQEIFARELDAHQRAVESNQRTFLDPYGAEDDGEFFSVITEQFFELPRAFRASHPELYDALRSLYRQDPGAYQGSGGG